jgi:hypothetical protein
VDLLRFALDEAERGSRAAKEIKKMLAIMLAKMANHAVNNAWAILGPKDEKDSTDLKMWVATLDSAKYHLKEAAQLDPSSSFVRDNFSRVQALIDDLGPLAQAARRETGSATHSSTHTSSRASSARASSARASSARASSTPAFSIDLLTMEEERPFPQRVFVGLLVGLAMLVTLTTTAAGDLSLQNTMGDWFIAVGRYGTFGPLASRFAAILGWPALVATFLMFFPPWLAAGRYLFAVVCGASWSKKAPFAKLVEIVIYLFAILYLVAMVHYIGRPEVWESPASLRSSVANDAMTSLLTGMAGRATA